MCFTICNTKHKYAVFHVTHNSSHYPRLSPSQFSLTSAESWPKTPFISFHFAHEYCYMATIAAQMHILSYIVTFT